MSDKVTTTVVETHKPTTPKPAYDQKGNVIVTNPTYDSNGNLVQTTNDIPATIVGNPAPAPNPSWEHDDDGAGNPFKQQPPAVSTTTTTPAIVTDSRGVQSNPTPTVVTERTDGKVPVVHPATTTKSSPAISSAGVKSGSK